MRNIVPLDRRSNIYRPILDRESSPGFVPKFILLKRNSKFNFLDDIFRMKKRQFFLERKKKMHFRERTNVLGTQLVNDTYVWLI